MTNEINISRSIIIKFSEKICVQLIQFVSSIILARLLEPEFYGIFSSVALFTQIPIILCTSGLTTLIVQKKVIQERELSTLSFFSIIVAFIFILILYIFAPFLASFFTFSSFTHLLRFYSLFIVLSAINGIYSSILLRNMAFKKMLICNLAACVLSNITSIYLAFIGFGVYVLFINEILRLIVYIIIALCFVRWVPHTFPSLIFLKKAMHFSKRIMLSDIFTTTGENMQVLIIGGKYSQADLGFVNKGKTIPYMAAGVTSDIFTNVMLSTFAKAQDNIELLRDLYRKAIRYYSYFGFFLMFSIAALSNEIIALLYTEKWINTVAYIKIFCICFSFLPFYIISKQLILAVGDSRKYLQINFIANAVLVVITILGLPLKIISFVIFVNCGYYLIVSLISFSFVKSIIKYKYVDLFKDSSVYLLIALFIYGVLMIPLSSNNIIIDLFVKGLIGIILFILINFIIKSHEQKMILMKVKEFVFKRKKER